MTIARPRIGARDWLGELRTVEHRGLLASLVNEISQNAPELEQQVYEIAKEFGAEALAKEIFARNRAPEAAQPKIEKVIPRRRRLVPETKIAQPPVGDREGMLAEADKLAARAKADSERLFISPDAQPEEESNEQTQSTDGTGAGGCAQWELNVAFAKEEEIEEDDEAIVLSPVASYDNAREYARRHCFREGSLAMYAWRDAFWEWDGAVYRVLPEDELKARVYEFLDKSVRREGKDFSLVRFRPKPGSVRDLMDGLRSGLALPNVCEPPMNLRSGEHVGDALMFSNELLNARTGERMGLSPELWIQRGIRYEWNPAARCPQWLAFLESIFPGDDDAKASVEELLGVSMTEDVRFQKGAMIIGEPRSGKGTIIKVGEGLCGSCASMDFDKWMVDDKGCGPLIGKKMIAFADVRLKEGKWYGNRYDPGGLDFRSVQRLLKIIAGDAVTIGRKYIAAFEGVLPGKVWFASNKFPNLNDAVLPTRFIKLAFDISFADRADINLADRLLTELPGIAVRCLAAYHRALAHGRLIQPASGAKLGAKVTQNSDAFAQFITENYMFDPKAVDTTFGAIYEHLQFWCKSQGRTDVLESVIPQNLKKHIRNVPGFADVEGANKTKKVPRRLLRIRRRTGEERKELREAAFDD